MTCELATLAGKEIDIFNQIESQLAYHAEARAKALSDLAGLADELRQAVDDYDIDPLLRQTLAGWHEDAKKSMPQ